MIGQTLGPYRITAKVGEGGMGEVYRATDTRLKRDVAIKMLPGSIAADADRLARFQREAEVLASLNHPNIAVVHGLEEGVSADGAPLRALVMELVEGEDLSQRIARGPIPVEEALPIAKQIAEALEAAHERGIVHRDLKPANIKVRPDGGVRVLDFGLAKALDISEAGTGSTGKGSLSMSPTITSPAVTQAGMILGTAAYMSPEQARGKTVDRRADIWAFGCVLYEMLTGRRAFEAEDVSLTLAEVMKSEPDWTPLPSVPPAVGAYLRQCLKKDPRQRVQAIGDVRLALEGAFQLPAPASVAAPPQSSPLWKRAMVIVATAVAAGVTGWMLSRSPIAPAQVQRVSIVLPADQSIAFGCTPCLSVAISPDGSQIVYARTRPDAAVGGTLNGSLNIRSLESGTVRELPGTNGAFQPFFSPDGRWVAFFTQAELKKVAVSGGNPVTLAANLQSASFSFGAWSDSHTIVVGGNSGLQRLPDEGGSPASITTVDANHGEQRHSVPDIIENTNTVIFSVFTGSGPRIEAVNLDGSNRRVVLENASAGRYLTTGHLLFRRDGVLLVAPFDPRQLTVTGTAVPIPDDVRPDGPAFDGPTPQLAVSRLGTLAYVPGSDPRRVAGVVTRSGIFEALDLPPDRINRVAVSADGLAVAMDVSAGATTELRVVDLARPRVTKLTTTGWSDMNPAWSPNGRALAVYSLKSDGTRGLFIKEAGVPERLLVATKPGPAAIRASAMSWSPDGAWLAYTVNTALGTTATDIWVAKTDGTAAPRAWLDSPTQENTPAFSPDGRWLAYVSTESGQFEVYIKRFPEGRKIQVTTAGGFGPVWRGDSKELFFQTSVAGAPKVMAVTLTGQGDELAPGKAVPLFDLRVTNQFGMREQYLSTSIVGRRWDAFPDGQRFLVVRGADPQSQREIVLVQHWDEELKRLTGAK